MKKSKLLALIMAGVMILSLFTACGKKDEGSNGGDGAKTYKVGVAIYEFNDNFMTLYRNEIEAYFKTLETDTVKYKVTTVDGKNDMATQTNQIDTFITQQMDVIICNLVQTSSAEAIIDKVVAAGIPLVLINREPLGETDESYPGILDNANVCYVGADARQSGTFQGEIVRDLPNKGDMNGDGVVKYVMIEGDPENVDAQYRTEFSIKALTDAGIKVECLVDQIGNWQTDKGQEIANSALVQYGSEIDVIFCNNDGMALGAAQAISANGRKVGEDILLLGVDALDDCVDMIKAGTMTGTVLNDHIGQSHKAVDVAVKLLNGETIDNYYWVDYVKVDSAYVNK
ncbi:MAG: galactose ABC transporter substrate-binding protein [Oscillospiraceae bacterium]|nr:galactose ABC transporter substrate-binding protein [Oscillospiraceae bacterium]